MNQNEAEIRKELGIPPAAERVVILSQSSHLDWDWLETFPVLYNQPEAPYFNANNATAESIFCQAAKLLADSPPPGSESPSYYYSLAEIGFLERFFELGPPADVATLQKAATEGIFHLVGGGITSPDSLLSHGECFIRNSLVAKAWVATHLPGSTVANFWVPDDFGHDSQLPATLEAMGLAAAAFERIPGGQFQNPGQNPLNGSPSAAYELQNNGIDFFWYADDGSKIIGHYLIGGYSQIHKQWGRYTVDIESYLQLNQPSSPTPYVFVPAGSDFNPPDPNLQSAVNDWNTTTSGPGYPSTGVYAVVATFDHYVGLVQAHGDNLVKRRFAGTPVWTGNYGSRPALKRWQYNATRLAMGAEVFGTINEILKTPFSSSSDWRTRLFDSWWLNVASTHHDYVVGTAADYNPSTGATYMDVYGVEQLPRLLLAKDKAQLVREEAMLALTQTITPKFLKLDYVNSEAPVAVFNELGFERTGLVELPHGSDHSTLKVRNSLAPDGDGLVQPTHQGTLLFKASAGSLGYSTSYLNGEGGYDFPSASSNLSITTSDSGATWVLKNDQIEVTVAKSAHWGITSIKDVRGQKELLKPGSTGNQMVFYADGGDIYQYGNEHGASSQMSVDTTVTFSDGGAMVTETGPLRATLETMIYAEVQQRTYAYKRTYSLVLDEPLIRMSCSGVGPVASQGDPGYSVMTRFAFHQDVKRLSYGTPNHWTAFPMVQPWPAPLMTPTHNFLIPVSADGNAMAGIYHDAIPSWGFDETGGLIGNLFRNTPHSGSFNSGANATDRGLHQQHYALRVPTGLGSADTGQPLREALSFQMPLEGRFISNLSTKTAPECYSLASLNAQSPACIVAAKPDWTEGSRKTVLRVYQPTNQTQKIDVAVSCATNLMGVNALEGDLDAEARARLNLHQTATGFSFEATRALTTIALDIA